MIHAFHRYVAFRQYTQIILLFYILNVFVLLCHFEIVGIYRILVKLMTQHDKSHK